MPPVREPRETRGPADPSLHAAESCPELAATPARQLALDILAQLCYHSSVRRSRCKMLGPNNRRCFHCGSRELRTYQETVFGFKVRVCVPCSGLLLETLNRFCLMRPELDVAAKPVCGRR